MEYTKEQQKAIDMIIGKNTVSTTDNLTPRTRAAVAAMLPTPEHLDTKGKEKFEALRKVAMRDANIKGVYAVDFDGVLCENQYPEIGAEKRGVIDKIKQLQKEGSTVILWTCRDGDDLQNALSWCVDRGLYFDRVNAGTDGQECRKLAADFYIDDKSISIDDL